MHEIENLVSQETILESFRFKQEEDEYLSDKFADLAVEIFHRVDQPERSVALKKLLDARNFCLIKIKSVMS